MNFSRSHKLPFRALVVAALVTSVVVASFLSGVVPLSSAGTRARAASRTNNAQETPDLVFAAIYSQTNLVSDLPGVALIEDRQLANPWGVALGPSSPFWVVDNQTDRATIYKGDVAGSPLVPNPTLPEIAIPNIPTLVPAASMPTATVANTTGDFLVSLSTTPPTPAQFIFATLNGGISAWQPDLGAVASVVKFVSGHSYTGLAIGNNATGNFLYAADFANGQIDVFDGAFNQTSLSGNFADATVPSNFHPYNIQNLGGALYVTYAEFSHFHDNDFGFVRKFDTNGVRDVAFAINNGPLANPWGLAIAPANFGPFSNLLLVGNYRALGINNPAISAFNPATGALFGHMTDGAGAYLRIDKLRALVFGNGVNGGDANTLYFTADIFDDFEATGRRHGLFGSLKPVMGIPATLIKLSSQQYSVNEGGGHVDITVTRSGDVSDTSTVNYATVDVSASQKAEFEIALGRLTFNPGETSKSFRVLIVDNNLAGGGSSSPFAVVLSNPTGAALVSPDTATVFISDNEGDTNGDPINIIDNAQSFVRQQYFDFLNREPDAAGLSFWTNQITSCGTDQQCIQIRRTNVSAAFFLSIEFQKTGMIAYLTERAASGALPRYGPFMRDVQALQKDYVFGAPGASAQLETNTRAFFAEFVRRPEFVAKYGGLSNTQYVDALLQSGGIAATSARLFIINMDWSQTVPPTATTSFGTAIARLSVASVDTMDFSLSFGLSSPETAAHIHGPALAGANAPPIVTLPNGEFRDFKITLTAQQGQDMRAGRLYVDVHTQNNPDGEIRGQISGLRFQRDVLVDALDHGNITRAEALRLIVEDADFKTNQLNRAFVLMEYFGYLRRNPNDPPDNNYSGYDFWLAKLNQFNGDFVQSEMVKAFIRSTEYRRRFGPP